MVEDCWVDPGVGEDFSSAGVDLGPEGGEGVEAGTRLVQADAAVGMEGFHAVPGLPGTSCAIAGATGELEDGARVIEQDGRVCGDGTRGCLGEAVVLVGEERVRALENDVEEVLLAEDVAAFVSGEGLAENRVDGFRGINQENGTSEVVVDSRKTNAVEG